MVGTPLEVDDPVSEMKGTLRKSLGRWDVLLFSLCALIGLDTLGQISSFGAQSFAWLVILAVFFVVPYALITSELGSTFTDEGGPYVWMKKAFGRFTASVGAVLYWISNPIWVGGTLCFVAAGAWSANVTELVPGHVADYVFKLAFIWFSIVVAILALRRGKWITALGAYVRVGTLALFSITVVIYGFSHGLHGYVAGEFVPKDLSVATAVVPLILFNYLGLELANAAGGEMRDPQRDVPFAVLRTAAITAVCYILPILGILLVLPTDKVSGLSGFVDAVNETFSVYGPAQHVLVVVTTLGFVFAVATSGSVWMIGSDRVQAVAAADHGFFPYFGHFHPRLGTPVRVNILSGVVSTAFMVAAQLITTGSAVEIFTVVLTLSTSTTLVALMFVIPSGLALRYRFPDVRRPYRVGRGNGPMMVCVGLCVGWLTVGALATLVPGALQTLFGQSYDLTEEFGVSRLRFEVFTVGTFGVIVGLAIVGFLVGRRHRTDVDQGFLSAALPPSRSL